MSDRSMMQALSEMFTEELRQGEGREVDAVVSQLITEYIAPMLKKVVDAAGDLTPGPFGIDTTELWDMLDPDHTLDLNYITDWDDLRLS